MGRGRFLEFGAVALVLALTVLGEVPTVAAESADADMTTLVRPGLRDELRDTVRVARDKVFPALVNIEVVTARYIGGKETKSGGVGSGTIISDTGLVVTNEHVTRDGFKFLCTLADKRQVKATLVGEDALTDLSVLQLDLSDVEGPLPVARFGSSAALEIGDVIMAMGSPFALSRSVSLGIVSNTERVFAGGFGNQEFEEIDIGGGQRTGLFTRWIQHDAVISPGNSGGPLVNLAGEIVGVNELGGGTLSFAIPSDLAARVVEELARNGSVTRSFWGLSIKPIRRTGIEEGVLISSVDGGGPAARAGVEAGDVLLAVDGEEVTVRFVEEVPLLLDRLASAAPGTTFQLHLKRGDDELTVALITERLEQDLGRETSFHDWGFTARDITSKMARDGRLDSADGVVVTGVRRGGPASQSEPALMRGDVIKTLDGRPVKDLEALVEQFKQTVQSEGAAPDGVSPAVVVAFDRRGTNQLTVLQIDRRSVEDPPREIPKAWIGVAAQPVVPPLSDHLGMPDLRGMRITRVYPGAEADTAGLRTGDLVVAVDGRPLTPSGQEDITLLARTVRDRDIGSEVELTVLRGDESLNLTVPLERTRISPVEARRHTDRDFEITVREATFFDRDERRWDDSVRGVLVESVEVGGWAALGGVQGGDLVLRIGDSPIQGLKSFRSALAEVGRNRPQRVTFVVLRGIRTYFQFLEPDWAPQIKGDDDDAHGAGAEEEN